MKNNEHTHNNGEQADSSQRFHPNCKEERGDVRHPFNRRLTIYIDKETADNLTKAMEELSMKPTRIVSGLLFTLFDTEEKPEYAPLYHRVKKFFLRNETKKLIERIEKILPSTKQFPTEDGFPSEALIRQDTQWQKRFKEDTLFWATRCKKIGVLAILDPVLDFPALMGNMSALKIEEKIEDLVVIIAHGADQIAPEYRFHLQESRIHLVSMSNFQNRLEEKFSEHEIPDVEFPPTPQ